jgi:hypothetical protein
MSNDGAAPRAAVPVSNARAAASRRNGARSRGSKTPEGKARSSQNALKHGLRADKHVVLPDEDAAEFHALEAAMMEELAPTGALQVVLARRVAIAAWRLARADRMEAEVLAVRGYDDAGPGMALIRDGNGTRSFETLLRYRGAAMAEFMRALRTLKALQAEQAATELPAAAPARAYAQPSRPAARPAHAHLLAPNEPEPATAPAPGRTLHEPAAPWLANQHRTGPRQVADDIGARLPNEPENGGDLQSSAEHADRAQRDASRAGATPGARRLTSGAPALHGPASDPRP